MKRHLIPLALAAGFLLTVGVAPSSADTITFDNSSLHTGGTFGVGANVTIANGVIDAVAHDIPNFGFPITGNCTGGFGCINVSTGGFVGPVTTTTANDYAYMGNGSSITITGGIASLLLPNNTILFTGSFDANSNVILQFDDNCQTNPPQCTGSLTGTVAASTAAINPVLAAALGVNPNIFGGNEQTLFFNFSGVTLPGDSIAPSGSGIVNANQLQVTTPGAAAVPEPGSLMLLGSGLFLFARVVRTRLK
ncbi:MAG TPA: PEP-CTERM sorting domain-containing protein [Vicinamibacterales bacterium]|nr:PEP-CTERM sorting domain-containing protein [Vicinamibacterales bacterium]